MKTLVSLVLATVASVSDGVEANNYDCKGQGVTLHMSTAGYGGSPTLTVTPASVSSANSPGGVLANVVREDNFMGISVTGRFTQIADATLVYTLIVPDVIVGDSPIGSVKGMLVRTLSGGLIPPTSNYPHVVQSNTFTPVVCDASHVIF